MNLDWVVSSGSHQRPPYLIKRKLQNHWSTNPTTATTRTQRRRPWNVILIKKDFIFIRKKNLYKRAIFVPFDETEAETVKLLKLFGTCRTKFAIFVLCFASKPLCVCIYIHDIHYVLIGWYWVFCLITTVQWEFICFFEDFWYDPFIWTVQIPPRLLPLHISQTHFPIYFIFQFIRSWKTVPLVPNKSQWLQLPPFLSLGTLSIFISLTFTHFVGLVYNVLFCFGIWNLEQELCINNCESFCDSESLQPQFHNLPSSSSLSQVNSLSLSLIFCSTVFSIEKKDGLIVTKLKVLKSPCDALSLHHNLHVGIC